jgi:hypothetical protein
VQGHWCVRRPIAIAQNGASRSPISDHPDHTKRRIPITDFGMPIRQNGHPDHLM